VISVPPSPTERNDNMNKTFVSQSIIICLRALPWPSGMGTFAEVGFSTSTNVHILLVHSMRVPDAMHCNFVGKDAVIGVLQRAHFMNASICLFSCTVSRMTLVGLGTLFFLLVVDVVNDELASEVASANNVLDGSGVLVSLALTCGVVDLCQERSPQELHYQLNAILSGMILFFVLALHLVPIGVTKWMLYCWQSSC